MAGYPIEALKKAETVTGLDIIPLQQNGITKQLERSIFDQAVIIKEAGSQSSGIIRKEGVFVLKNETQINFTLETAAGRIVEDNEYKDSAEAASGWIVYVVNTSGIQHTVIHDANSWPINAGEILCFYWTGSRFTLHNIVINNLTVRGDTKLLEVPAVQTLVAENKLAVIGADGKIISTTINQVASLVTANFSKVKIIQISDCNNAYPDENGKKETYFADGTAINTPSNSLLWFIESERFFYSNNWRITQVAISQSASTTNKPQQYIRHGTYVPDKKSWSWTSWEKVTTETDLANYEKKVVSVKLNVGSATLNGVNGHNYLIYLSHPYTKTGIYSFFAETNGTYSVQTVSEVGTSTKPTFVVNGLTLTITSSCKIDVIDLGLYN